MNLPTTDRWLTFLSVGCTGLYAGATLMQSAVYASVVNVLSPVEFLRYFKHVFPKAVRLLVPLAVVGYTPSFPKYTSTLYLLVYLCNRTGATLARVFLWYDPKSHPKSGFPESNKCCALRLLVSAGLLFSIIPVTLLLLQPTNKKLLGMSEADATTQTLSSLICTWNTRHNIRTFLGLAAFVLSIW